MKITRKQLRRLIQEASDPYDPVRVKTVDPEDFAPVGHPVPRFEKPRSEEIPLYRNGRFFVAKHPKDTRRGYAYPNKFYSFYMMPIGSDEALLIPSIEGNLSLHRITSVNNAKKYIDWLAMKTDGMDDMSQIIQVIVDTPKEISHHPKHMPSNIGEAIGFRNKAKKDEVTGSIHIIRYVDPKHIDYVGYKINGILRGVQKINPSDSRKYTIELGKENLTHTATKNTTIKKRLPHMWENNLVYEPLLDMLFKPFLDQLDDSSNYTLEDHFVWFMISDKLEALGYKPLPRQRENLPKFNYYTDTVEIRSRYDLVGNVTGSSHKSTRNIEPAIRSQLGFISPPDSLSEDLRSLIESVIKEIV
jgi:hypothetical protein